MEETIGKNKGRVYGARQLARGSEGGNDSTMCQTQIFSS